MRTAHCACGSLRADATGDPIAIVACHCRECQRRTGAPFGVTVLFPKEQVRIDGPIKEYVRNGQEGRKVRLTAGEGHEVHGFLARPFEPVEFDVLAAATAGGKLTLIWTPEPGAGGPGRGCQVCEVWVLKKPRR